MFRRKSDGKRRKILTAAGISAVLACMGAAPVYAGSWVQPQENSWVYEEDGVPATHWREIDGTWYYFDDAGIMQTGWVRTGEDQIWYYLDRETGAWLRRPVLDGETARKLLENAVNRSGYYRNEEREWEVHIDSIEGNTIYASVRVILGPNGWTTLNNYKIHKKTGIADGATGADLDLYAY